MNFMKEYSLTERIEKYNKITQKYPKSIPVVIEGLNVKKNMFLFPNDFSYSDFVSFIKTYIPSPKITFISETPSYLLKHMIEIYEKFKHSDGFLYVRVS